MGLFGFGNQSKYVDEQDNSATEEKTETFFLDADDAQSLGNVEYMRKSKKIRRTFPKTKNFQGGELIKEVSALEDQKISGNEFSQPAANSTATPQPEAENIQASSQRRRADHSMDMFRNMAKDIKK